MDETFLRFLTRWKRYEWLIQSFYDQNAKLQLMIQESVNELPISFIKKFDKWEDSHIEHLTELLEVMGLLEQDMEGVMQQMAGDVADLKKLVD
jgi:hypothetical protein